MTAITLHDVADRIDARNARLSQSGFDDVNLSKATFSNVNLTGARFENVNFSDVTIDNVNIHGFRIRGVLVSDLFAAYTERRHD